MKSLAKTKKIKKMGNKIQKWIRQYDHLYNNHSGAYMILENNRYFTPVAIVPEPQGCKSVRQAQNAKLIEMAPELLEFVKKYATIEYPYNVFKRKVLLDKANRLINKIES